MTALVATDVTIVVQDRQRLSAQKRHRVKITFGNGALTYPALGIPLPAFGVFGMKRVLDYLIIFDNDDAAGIYWKFDKDNKKLRAYRQGVTTGATATAASGVGALAVGENATEGAARIPNTAASTAYDFGPLQECTTAYAPGLHTLYAEAVGS